MPYTNGWTINVPLGSDQANTADDQIRRFRLDVQERMNTLLGGTNWANDPVLTMTGNILIIPFFFGVSEALASVTMIQQTANGYCNPSVLGTNARWFVPLNFSGHNGIVITKVRASLFWTAACTASLTVYSSVLSAPAAPTSLGTVSSASAGWSIQDAAIANYTVINTESIYAVITLTSSGAAANTRYGGLEVTYNRTNV